MWRRDSYTGKRLWAADFRGFQEVIISRGIQRQVVYALGVHQHVVEKPKIDGRQVGGEDFLDLGVDRLAPREVGFRKTLLDQFVDSRIDVKAAVGAVGRELVGMER